MADFNYKNFSVRVVESEEGNITVYQLHVDDEGNVTKQIPLFGGKNHAELVQRCASFTHLLRESIHELR